MTVHLASMIDHTVLKSSTTVEQIHRLCAEAEEFGFASVCVNPCYVPLAADLLKDSKVKVCTVIGFPLGANTTATKIFEAKDAIQLGADELDYVVNISDVLNNRFDRIKKEMEEFVQVRSTASKPVMIKIILETCYLTDEQIKRLCELAKESGLDFVKTSTGFGTGGATAAHVQLMRETVGPNVGVKASGGIRNYQDAMTMVEAGANRIGASSGIAIVTQKASGENKGY
ncbi:deoxyribose-phosphate aldolase [Desulforamulus ruminis]|uniref:Deoxyribose-phosphate aldolase n=1 Tax=Desulforamulus ruminis (strain ATCC 23193 / DSM 2154 / NCIMB 8452 / DL) TaxID=696281 RepID=F6DR13_DESRL|nr:deoxyribose-phosphate aldolase [Desulforamulus ruminis]AEG59732.1 deoxyribose-phosphate aldolase [Desulforamulus ruminis DSM 2154]